MCQGTPSNRPYRDGMTQTEPQMPQSQQRHAWAQVPPDAGGERPSRKLATIALVFAVVMVLAGVVQGIVIAVLLVTALVLIRRNPLPRHF